MTPKTNFSWQLPGMVLGLFVALSAGSRARGEEGALTLPVLKNLKAATVFLKVEAGRDSWSGSGFVVQVEGQTAYVATNYHVVDSDKGRRPLLKLPTIQAVFSSSTKEEQTLQAEIVGTDPRHDLAVLKVTGLAQPPPAIAIGTNADLVETMTIYSLGFPFGEELTTNKKNPAITVNRGTISSLRKNEQGKLTTIQVAGDFSPGNSGGPVVDGKGQLVGIATAAVRTRPIGFAVPSARLAQILQGHLVDYQITSKPGGAGNLEVEVRLGVFDPLNKLKGINLYYLSGDVQKIRPGAKKLAGVPGVQKAQLVRNGREATSKFILAAAADPTVTFQALFVDGRGKTYITNPRVRHLRQLAAPAPVPVPAKPPAQVAGTLKDLIRQPGPLTWLPVPQGKKAIQLIPLIDPRRDTVQGHWEVVDHEKSKFLICREGNFVPRVQIPYQPPAEYDFSVSFAQPKLRNGISLVMPNPRGGSFFWFLGTEAGRRYGFGTRPELSKVSPGLIQTNVVYTTTVQVRKDGVKAFLNGKLLLEHKSDFSDLNSDGWRKLKDESVLAVACDDPVIFYHVQVVELTGKGKQTRDGPQK